MVLVAWPATVRSAFTFSACARAALAFTNARFVDRIRTGATGHRRFWIHDLAAVDPNFHTDLPKRRPRFGQAVIDVGAQSVKRKLSLQVPLAASDLSAVQTSTDLHLDSLSTKSQRLFNRFSHRTTKRDALLELRGDLLSLKLCVQLGLVDLLDRNKHFAASLHRQIALELVDLSALATDDDSRSRRVDDDLEAIRGSFDYIVRSKKPFSQMDLQEALRECLILLDIAADLDAATGGWQKVLPVAKTITVDGIEDVPADELRQTVEEIDRASGERLLPRPNF